VDKAHYSGIEGEGRSGKESVELERGVGVGERGVGERRVGG